MAISPSAFFRRLGAPLANSYWSWGALHRDGTVILRVWQDERMEIDGRRFIRLINHAEYQTDQHSNGYAERLTHLEALHQGAPGYVIICRAEDEDARPRTIASFERRDIVELGEIRIVDGDEWGELRSRIPVRTFLGREAASN